MIPKKEIPPLSMTAAIVQVAYPFKLNLTPPGTCRRFVHGIEIEDLSVDGVYYPGRNFTEFHLAVYLRSMSASAGEALDQQRALVDSFQTFYPHQPLHPDRAAHTLDFDRAHRRLCRQIGASLYTVLIHRNLMSSSLHPGHLLRSHAHRGGRRSPGQGMYVCFSECAYLLP